MRFVSSSFVNRSCSFLRTQGLFRLMVAEAMRAELSDVQRIPCVAIGI